MWSAQRIEAESNPSEVSINWIEEPEARLPPNQQRKLSCYLVENLNSQVLLNSHSPHIACEFDHASIVSLSFSDAVTIAANSGCSPIIENNLTQFGHRLFPLRDFLQRLFYR
mgnify:FL=1